MTLADEMSPEMENKIQVLRTRFVKEMDQALYEDKYMFYRFLKARDFNLDQAEHMLRKTVEEYIAQCLIGYDKEGCPVRYYAYGNLDFKGWRMAAKWKDRIESAIKLLENEMKDLEEQIKKTGKNFMGITCICDMKNFSFATATDRTLVSELIYLANLHQDNHPERLERAILINVSPYFSFIFSILKSFIAASILNKISMYSSPDEWMPQLRKHIDVDVLPAFLGGNRTDPNGDPLCKSFVNHGGKIPSELYIHKSINSLTKSKDAKRLTLPRAAFSEIEIVVKEAGSFIEWEFEIKCRDIGFGLFLKELEPGGKEKITELVPLLRLDTEEFSENGVYKCEKPGIYVMLFDNSFSWMRCKEIYYKCQVVNPDDKKNELVN